MHTYRWMGREIAWQRMGSGPPLVFCHGTPWSSYVWERLASRLAETRTVYLWDMPGFGRSSKRPDHGIGLHVQAEAFADLLSHWRLDCPYVVAHDIGGAVALGAHLLHDRDLTGLLLMDVVLLHPWGSDFFRLVRDHADVFAGLPPALHQALVSEYIRGASHRGLTSETLAHLVEPWTGVDGRRGFYAQIAQADAAFTEALVERLSEVRCPTRVAWGEQDAWIPVEQAHRLAELLGAPAPAIVTDAGHLVQLDAAGQVQTIVEQSVSMDA